MEHGEGRERWRTLRRIVLGPPRTPAHLQSRGERVASFVAGTWDLATGAYLAMAALVSVSRVSGDSAPPLLQPLQAVFPVVVAPAVVVAVTALARRRYLHGMVAVVLVVTGWLAVRPALRSHRLAAPPANAITVTLLQANVLYANPTPEAFARVVDERDADIVAIEELSPPIDAALEAAGIYDRYPYRHVTSRPDADGSALLSKLPFDDVTASDPLAPPEAVVELDAGAVLRVVMVHPDPPLKQPDAREWTSTLRRLRDRVGTITEPVVFVGDWNASRWQPAFGAVLGTGARDVHEELGRGLSRSWPMGAGIVPPFVRLDHAVVNNGVVPMAVTDVDVPGSDHRGFLVTLAVPTNAAPDAVDAAETAADTTDG